MSVRQMGMGDIINQATFWRSRVEDQLVFERLDQMTPRHLANVKRWLEANARKLQSSEVLALYSIGSMIQGEQALIDLDADISFAEAEAPMTWLRGKPLYEEITRLLARTETEGASDVPPF